MLCSEIHGRASGAPETSSKAKARSPTCLAGVGWARCISRIIWGMDLAVLHLDVRPTNVLLEIGDEGGVKITDFGLARVTSTAAL